MSWIDWLIVILPIAFVVWIAFFSKRYVKGVVDYLAAGRVAGRYVISVGDLMAGLSVITLVANAEQYYQTGFGVAFWANITAPIGIVLALTGFISRDKNILLILGISLLYIFLYAMILFCRKRNRSLQIPYLPFLLAAYITAWMTG